MIKLYTALQIAAVIIFAYLMGSISTAIIVGKLKSNIDIREHGSGNAGATNTLRTQGKLAGMFVLLGDVLKTAIIMTIVIIFFPQNPEYVYIAGVGAVLGHNFPIYFKFKGGKGVLVSIVSIIFASPLIGLCTLAIGVLVIVITRFVSLGSIVGAISAVILGFIFAPDNDKMIVFFVIIAILSLKMHSANIVRLFKGEENKIGKKDSQK